MERNRYIHLTREVTVAVNDTDFRQRIKPGAIMSYFQDIASEHADLLGIGYDEFMSKNLLWVILRMSVKVFRCPAVGETLTIETFPEKPGAADVNRGYYALDKSGETVIAGSSKWCVIDKDSHRIQRLAPIFENFDHSLFIPVEPLEGANPKLGALPADAAADVRFSGTVVFTELDRNGHMNNARYGDVVQNACGMEILGERFISRFDINFVSQMFCGDRYNVFMSDIGDEACFEAKKLPGTAGGGQPPGKDTVFRARAQFS